MKSCFVICWKRKLRRDAYSGQIFRRWFYFCTVYTRHILTRLSKRYRTTWMSQREWQGCAPICWNFRSCHHWLLAGMNASCLIRRSQGIRSFFIYLILFFSLLLSEALLDMIEQLFTGPLTLNLNKRTATTNSCSISAVISQSALFRLLKVKLSSSNLGFFFIFREVTRYVVDA